MFCLKPYRRCSRFLKSSSFLALKHTNIHFYWLKILMHFKTSTNFKWERIPTLTLFCSWTIKCLKKKKSNHFISWIQLTLSVTENWWVSAEILYVCNFVGTTVIKYWNIWLSRIKTKCFLFIKIATTLLPNPPSFY